MPPTRLLSNLLFEIHSPSRLTVAGTKIHLIYNGVEWVLYSSSRARGWRFPSRDAAIQYLNDQIAIKMEEG